MITDFTLAKLIKSVFSLTKNVLCINLNRNGQKTSSVLFMYDYRCGGQKFHRNVSGADCCEFFSLKQLFLFLRCDLHCHSTQRFVSKRASSLVDLASSSLDDVRAERATALSVGLSWPPVRHARSRGQPSWQHQWECAPP